MLDGRAEPRRIGDRGRRRSRHVHGKLLAAIGPRRRPFDERDEHPRPDHHAADRDGVEVCDRRRRGGSREEQSLEQEPRHLRTAPHRSVECADPRVAAGCEVHHRLVDARGQRGGDAEPPHLLVQLRDLLLESGQRAGASSAWGSLMRAAPRARPSPPGLLRFRMDPRTPVIERLRRRRRLLHVLGCRAAVVPRLGEPAAELLGGVLLGARWQRRRLEPRTTRRDQPRERGDPDEPCRPAEEPSHATIVPRPAATLPRLPATPRSAVPGRRTTPAGPIQTGGRRQGPRDRVRDSAVAGPQGWPTRNRPRPWDGCGH